MAIHENGDLDVLDAETLAPVGESVDLGESALHVSTSPAGETAFVVLGGPAGQWYQHYAARSWALVDTERRTVVRTGELGLDGAEVSAFSPDGRHAHGGRPPGSARGDRHSHRRGRWSARRRGSAAPS